MYTAPFALTGDAVHTLVVTTTDIAGNTNTQTFTIKIDSTAPTVSESFSGAAGANGWYIGAGNDTLTANDATSGIASVTYSLGLPAGLSGVRLLLAGWTPGSPPVVSPVSGSTP